MLPMLLVLLPLALSWGLVLGQGMTRVLGWFLVATVPPLVSLVVVLGTAVYVALTRRFTRIIGLTLCLALVGVWPIAWSFGILTITYPASLETTTPSIAVRLPVDQPVRVLWGGHRSNENAHVYAPDQRWAYDLGVEPVLTGTQRLEDYGTYGVRVLAPIGGRVVRVHDGEPDEVPGKLSYNFRSPLGNHVVIHLDIGTYLIIAHLKPGSVTVGAMDIVAEGQLIGLGGNSGNSSEPHIHIHHQRQDPRRSILAEGLPLFFHSTGGPSMPTGGVRHDGDRDVATGMLVQHHPKALR